MTPEQRVIPDEVLDLIEETPSIALPGIVTSEHECIGTKFHSPRPMTVRPFTLPRRGGRSEIVYLCGTCTDNVQVLLALLKQRGGDVSWPVKRCFGSTVRGVAVQAYVHSPEETDHA